VPTAEEWRAALRGAVDPSGALSDATVRGTQLRIVLGFHGDLDDPLLAQPVADGQRMIEFLIEQAAAGALDGLLEGKVLLVDVARRLNEFAEVPAGYVMAGGGIEPLLSMLVDYVKDHPFATPSN